jgi:hypothetical protein
MAKIKTSALVADIKGTVGGNVFASNKGGNYVRRGKKPTNANTEKQQAVRSAFGAQSGLWRTLTDAQRRSWIEGAVNFPYMDSLGEMKVYSGQQLFNKLNNNLIQYGQTTLEVCPTPQTFPALAWANIVNNKTANVLEITVAFNESLIVPADFVLVISATAVLSNGIESPARQRFKNITTLPATTDVDGLSVVSEYDENFNVMESGTTIFMGAMLVNTLSGESSPMVTLKTTRGL